MQTQIKMGWSDGYDVISCSWGWVGNPSQAVINEINLCKTLGRSGKGIIIVCSAGNDNLNTNSFFPANLDDVISVIASNPDDQRKTPSDGWSSTWGSNYGFNDLAAPGTHITTTDLTGTSGYNYTANICPGGSVLNNDYTFFNGTSAAAPVVAGIVALMLQANPCLSFNQVKDILINTADKVGGYNYNWSTAQPGYSLELGYGRVNAFKAVSAALAMYNAGLDVYIKDTPVDWGVEANPDNGPMWISDDIWVRNINDGGTEHQSPEYWINPNVDNYVYVKVRNQSCNDFVSTSTDLLHIYWAKAATAFAWPSNWDGSTIGNCSYCPNGAATTPSMGDEIPSSPLQLPNIPAGGEAILVFPWHVPNPDDYCGCNTEPWHFCLLSRIVSPQDPIIVENSSVYDNAKNNNNIAWKNLTIVNYLPGIVHNEDCYSDRQVGGVIAVGNAFNANDNYKLEFKLDDKNNGIPIFEQAQIKLTLDDLTWEKWAQGGYQANNIEIKREDCHQLIITGDPAYLKNLSYTARERSTMNVSFNFITDRMDETPEFDYHVIQKRTEDDKIIGGELYRIRKPQRTHFSADGGGDKTISEGASTTLSADNIGENAYYNWYDPDGNLIYSGNDLTVSPEITTKYKLEVIAISDGFSSFDSVTVKIKDCEIQSITPNPATSQITVEYKAQNVTSGYLVITHISGSPNDNYILNLNQNTKTINVANYISGTYNLILVCNGEIKDQKTLSIVH